MNLYYQNILRTTNSSFTKKLLIQEKLISYQHASKLQQAINPPLGNLHCITSPTQMLGRFNSVPAMAHIIDNHWK